MTAAPLNELASPGIGHNQPVASDIAAEVVAKEIAAADQWAGIAAIADATQASRAQDAIDHLSALHKKYDAERAEEKRPHDQAALDVQKRWRPILARIEACLEPIKALRKRWLDAEEMRLAKERAIAQAAADKAQREAEAAARKAEADKRATVSAKLAAEEAAERARQAAATAAAIPDRARTRGSYGAPARSLTVRWHAEVTDIVKAMRIYRDRPEMAELVTRLATAEIRAAGADRSDAAVKAWATRGVRIYSTKE